MPSIFEGAQTRKPDLIDANALVPPLWRHLREDGTEIAPFVRFLRDGRIGGVPDGDAWALWTLDDGALRILSDAGEPAAVLNHIETRLGRPVMTGEYPGRGDATPMLVPNLDDLGFDARIGEGRDAVYVSFETPDALSEGIAIAPGVWAGPESGDIDRIALAERLGPAFCYLNKTARIVDLLATLIRPGISRVVLSGGLGGGLAAMLIAELLAARLPDRTVSSVTLNPLGRLDDAANLPGGLRLPDPALLGQCDTWFTDVPRIHGTVSRRQGEVSHLVLFDSDNPAATWHADALRSVPHVTLRAVPIGQSAGEGVRAMVASGAAAGEIAARLTGG